MLKKEQQENYYEDDDNDYSITSPLLSALKVRITYLMVVCKVSVQMMHDRLPIIKFSVMLFPFMMALSTYKGDVPISP